MINDRPKFEQRVKIATKSRCRYDTTKALSIHYFVRIFSSSLLCFILNLHQHLMYSLDLKTMDKVVCQIENSSVQAKVGYDELAKIRSRPTGTVPALICLRSLIHLSRLCAFFLTKTLVRTMCL